MGSLGLTKHAACHYPLPLLPQNKQKKNHCLLVLMYVEIHCEPAACNQQTKVMI